MPFLAVAPLTTALTPFLGATLAAAGAQLVVGIGTSLVANALMSKAQGKARQDVKLQVEMGDDLPLSFCVGDFATAGKRKYIGSWGKNRRYITEVIEYSCLPQGLAGIWVNDERGAWHSAKRWAVPPSADPSHITSQEEVDTLPAGALDLGRPLSNLRDDGNRIYVKVIDGTQTAADPFLVWAFGSDSDYPWTSAHIGKGKSYVIITTRYDSDTLTSYPTFLIEPAPLPMYDPRKDGSTGGTGAHRWGDRATYEPTSNAAVIAYNIARGIYLGDEWIFGGRNLPAWRLPRAAWVAAMTACDASVALAEGGSEPAYRAGLEISVDRPAADVLEALGLAANMRFAEVGGRIKPLVDLPAASAFSLDDGDALVTQAQTATPFAPLSAVFNTLGATYPSQVAKWTSADAPQYTDTAALAADGGRQLATSVSYEAAPYPHQVQRLMRGQMRDYRRERRHQLVLPPAAMALEPVVDMLAFTSARNGYASKHFLIEQAVRTMAMNVTLSLREVDPADYDWSPAWEMPVTETAPVALVPWVQAVSGFTAVGVAIEDGDGAARRAGIRLSCDGSEAGVREIWVQVRQPGATLLEHDGPFDFVAPHQWLVPNLIGDTAYQVRARLVSRLTTRSLWTAWVDVTTPDVRLKTVDLDQQVWDQMGAIAIDAGVVPVATLPVAGDRDGQIVMLVPPGQLYRWDATAGAWTANLYAGIPDGAINIAKFAAGLEPVTLHTGASLPTVKSTEALSWNGKLYRWSGSAYVATVPAADVTGQLTNAQIAELAAAKLTGAITGTQIADNAISTPKLAAGAITTAKLAASAVTADTLAANAVTAAKVAAGAITTAKLAAEAVTANEIAANAVTTAKIAAGAVTAAEIAAGAVAVKHLVVSNFTNLFAGTGAKATSPFQPTASANSGNGEWATAGSSLAETHRGQPPLYIRGAWPNGAAYTIPDIAVKAGEQYHVSFLATRDASWDGTTSNSKLRFGSVDTGAHILSVPYDAASVNHFQSSAGPSYRTATLTIPEGTTTLAITLGNDATAGVVHLSNFEMRLKNGGELIVDGAITANKIATDAVTANAIAAGAIVASGIAAGAVSTDKLAASAVTAAKLAAGAVTADKIAAGSITAAKLAAGEIIAESMIVGGATSRQVVVPITGTIEATGSTSFGETFAQSTFSSGSTDFLMQVQLPVVGVSGHGATTLRILMEVRSGAIGGSQSWSVVQERFVSFPAFPSGVLLRDTRHLLADVLISNPATISGARITASVFSGSQPVSIGAGGRIVLQQRIK